MSELVWKVFEYSGKCDWKRTALKIFFSHKWVTKTENGNDTKNSTNFDLMVYIKKLRYFV